MTVSRTPVNGASGVSEDGRTRSPERKGGGAVKMAEVMERECSALGGLFHALIGDMKVPRPHACAGTTRYIHCTLVRPRAVSSRRPPPPLL